MFNILNLSFDLEAVSQPALYLEIMLILALLGFRILKDVSLGATYSGGKIMARALDLMSVPLLIIFLGVIVSKFS